MARTLAQQAIRDLNRRAARGEITAAEAKHLAAQAQQAEQQRLFRAALDVAAAAPPAPAASVAHFAPEPDPDTPARLVRPFVSPPAAPGEVPARGVARVYHTAHLILIGRLNTVGMLIAAMDRYFVLADVSDPEPHPEGVLVEATIAPPVGLATVRVGRR